MKMFESFLASVPKSRSDMVNDLHPEHVILPPYVWTEPDPDDSLSVRSDSLSGSCSLDEYDVNTISTDSSIPLSRAMTDSEIDYERYRKLKSRSLSDPWHEMRTALDAFSSDYLSSLSSFQNSSSELDSYTPPSQPRRNEALELKMRRFFDEECRVFAPDDPGLVQLEEALHAIDLKGLERLDNNEDYGIPTKTTKFV